jgi:hypothetical protein
VQAESARADILVGLDRGKKQISGDFWVCFVINQIMVNNPYFWGILTKPSIVAFGDVLWLIVYD